MRKNNPFRNIVWQNVVKAVILAVVFLFALLMLIGLSGCEFTKDVQKARTSETTTAKGDSGTVARQESKTDSREDWWRETFTKYMGTTGQSDTNQVININLPPGQQPAAPVYLPGQPQPIYIYQREGGTRQASTVVANYDSLWRRWNDSTAMASSTKNKQSDTDIIGPGVILAVVGGIGMLLVVVLVIVLVFVNKRFGAIAGMVQGAINRTS